MILSPETLAHLRAAKVPLVPGMRAWPSEREDGAAGIVVEMLDGWLPALWWPDTRRIEALPPAPGCGTPDPRDRATFLLLCDLAEQRGVGWFTTGLDHLNIGLARGHRRAWEQEDKRAATIAGLCRALAETEAGRG